MTLRPAHGVIAGMAVVIAILTWALIYFSRDELGTQAEKHDDQIKSASAARIEDGRPVVRISAESQQAAGIVVANLKSATREAALETYGAVANLQPLAELRGRYLAALAESKAIQASVASAQLEYRRMDMLYRDDRNVSEQALKAAQSRHHAELARQAAADQTVTALRDAIRAAWGATVAGWATDPDSQTIQSLMQQSAFLVQLVFPHELPGASARGRVTISPAGAPEQLYPASFVGSSPQMDPGLPGATYFYLVKGEGLRTGMRVTARVKADAEPKTGVIVPLAAVVWHAGKAWAYVKDDEQTFGRFEVATDHEMEGGWFNTKGFDTDDEVVVSGAQLLLSEELKYQIRNENED